MLAERLKKLREENSLKQETLANEIGCTRYMISYYENGREPSNDVLKAYCSRFNVSSDFLLGLSNERCPAGGTLPALFADLARLAGDEAPDSTELASLLEASVKYYRRGAPCGPAPMRALRGFTAGLRAALIGAAAGDGPATLDGANAAAVAALEVTKMPAALYQSQKP